MELAAGGLFTAVECEIASYMHIYAHLYAHTYMHAYEYIHTQTHTCAYNHMHTQTHAPLWHKHTQIHIDTPMVRI